MKNGAKFNTCHYCLKEVPYSSTVYSYTPGKILHFCSQKHRRLYINNPGQLKLGGILNAST